MAEEENKDEITEDTLDSQNELIDSSDEIDDQDKISNEDENQAPIKQKQVPILNKILFGLVGFLLFTLIVGAILFFMGFFEPEKKSEIKEIINEEKVLEEKNTFNIKDINSKKLNKQLLLLTNKNIVQEEENNRREKEEEEKKIKEEEDKKKAEALALEEENLSKEKKLLEDKKLELQGQKEELELLKNEAIALRDEMINIKENIDTKKNEIVFEEPQIIDEPEVEKIIEEKPILKEVVKEEIKFVSLINVAKVKGELLKSYLDKISGIYSTIKLCRDDLNRIEIYYGPFEDNALRTDIYNKLQENGIINSYEVELTKEEFDKRCNY